MAFCRSVLVLSVLCLLHSVTASQVPVFLWGDLATSSIKANPLNKVSGDEFKSLLEQQLKSDPFTVFFIDETLSVEDFSLKNGNGQSSFPYLHANIGKSVYLPAVDIDETVLNELANPETVDHVKLTENGLSAEIKPESGKILFISLKDAKEGESRADLLRRHNDFMEDMFSKLRDRYISVVAVYTAHFPSWTIPKDHSRVRRQAATAETEIEGLYKLDGVLLYVKKLEFHDGNNTIPLSGGVTNPSVVNDTELEASITFGERKVTLFFNNAGGYWFFNKVSVEEKSQLEELEPTEQAVYVLDGFSYRCAQSITFASINTTKPYSLTFADVKIQPFTGNSTQFSESLNCVGFFSVPIWSGLFVVFILLAITFYGIMMMMDIRTMDRFDDPKGKTITINAAE